MEDDPAIVYFADVDLDVLDEREDLAVAGRVCEGYAQLVLREYCLGGWCGGRFLEFIVSPLAVPVLLDYLFLEVGQSLQFLFQHLRHLALGLFPLRALLFLILILLFLFVLLGVLVGFFVLLLLDVADGLQKIFAHLNITRGHVWSPLLVLTVPRAS
jgi:hypothetical protein